MIQNDSSWTRRRFLGSAAAALAAPAIIPGSALGKAGRPAPSNRITLGFIGMGTMNSGHLGEFLGRADVQVLAVCDVWKHRIEQSVARTHGRYAEQLAGGTYRGCDGYTDFRELLARDDIDAVVIATPDHWHTLTSVAAMHAGKDVYCEKPLTHTIEESKIVTETTRRLGRVFQTGSQQRSSHPFRFAAEMVRSGRIGKVHTIRVNVGPPPQYCYLPAEPTPTTLDWDMWLGPALWRPYASEVCPRRDGTFPNWRGQTEFAGGGLADMGAHHFDIAQWALGMDDSGPVEIVPPETDGFTGLGLKYTNGTIMYHEPGCVNGTGLVFEGEGGSITAVRWHTVTDPVTIGREPIGARETRLYRSDNHKSDWLDCIRNRQKPIADVEIGARTAAVCHLCNIGYALRRPLKYDPANWRFVDDAEANRMASRAKRDPWQL